MDELYPAGPADVPADLTRPTRAYRRHAYLAVAGLLGFVALYFALAGWFAWTAYRLLSSIPRAPDRWLVLGLGGGAAGFLAVFMLKALVFVRRGKPDDADLELTPAEHPRLFAFLHRLADEARAPRPHRVIVAPQVNAAVFYDLSIANLILPSKKNLVIGLGLINVLTLAELKAVLAHELGHFAQRTMAVGRWVYVARQIAGHIVVKRDALDDGLRAISNIDLRVAWIGWILRGIVWSIRSLVDTMFGWVVMAERALSREMELQADLVAVSLTGSDALIHALHRLDAADDAMDRALGFAADEQRAGRAVADVFAVQSRMLERKRAILDDPGYGQVPPLPADPAEHRLFRAQLAHPPRMWATHPPSELREHNAKRVYVPAPLDDRSGWLLFDDPDGLRARVTARLYDDAERRPQLVPIDDSLARLDQGLDRRYLDPTYRGVYLGRSIVRDASTVDELFGAPPAGDLAAAIEDLYPASLTQDLARVRDLTEELATLQALERGLLEAPGRVIRFRGQDHKRKRLPALITQAERELAAARRIIRDHDRAARAAHLAAARVLGGGWDDYLRGLVALMHYVDHAEADLDDAAGCLRNVFAIVTADRKVSEGELDRLVQAATELHGVLDRIYADAGQVALGDAVAGRFEAATWKEALGDFELGGPHGGNIGPWLDASGSWVNGTAGILSTAYSAALEELLRTEEQLALWIKAGQPATAAPPPPRVPPRYPLLTPGKERPRQTRLGWWDRFQIADGIVPGAARFAVAGAIVGGVVLAGRAVGGDATIYVYNGLDRSVVVEIGTQRRELLDHDHVELTVEGGEAPRIVARTTDGEELEAFQPGATDDFGRYVYNIAAAAPLVELTYQQYGGDVAPRRRPERWFATDADRIHDRPPEEIHAAGDVASVSVLASLADRPPALQLGGLSAAQRAAVVLTHARWEPADAVDLASWLAQVPPAELAAVLQVRLARDPDDVMARRLEQDHGGPEVCDDHRARAAASPAAADWQYLAARCEADPAVRDRAFLALSERFPEAGWPAYAAAIAHEHAGRWELALTHYGRARVRVPAMREPIATELARLRRAAAGAGASVDAALGELAAEAPTLELLLALEADRRPDAAEVVPYWHLGRGELDQALAGAAEPGRLVMVAASDGAPAEVVTRALDVPVERLDPYSAVFGYALAVRAGKDPAPYLAATTALGDDAVALRGFLERLRAAPTPAATLAADAELAVDLRTRATAYAAAAVLLGERCPPAWRELARRALFVAERPFLKAS